MPRLNVAPTKSNLLALRRQLSVAEEGYDLLDQKRQILIFELMSRLRRAREAERRVADAARAAFAALREAALDLGSVALDRAALGVRPDHRAEVTEQRLMGIRLPRVAARVAPGAAAFGVGGTCAQADAAMRRFLELLPLLAQRGELENAVVRLGRELRKTQRRCNALSRIFIPDNKATIAYIAGTLEERERESFVILKMIRDHLAPAR